MKKLLLSLVLSGVASAAFGQGQLNFASAAAGVNAPATNRTALVNSGANLTGSRASGAAFLATLYIGPAATVDASLLTTNGFGGAPVAFNTGAQAGYFTGGARVIAGVAGGQTITAQIRAWNSAFPSWEAAPASERTAISGLGAPNLIQVTLGIVPPGSPTGLVGLQGYEIGGIPEPSSIALGLLGLGAIALFRRRK